jgi:hypothetical protein
LVQNPNRLSDADQVIHPHARKLVTPENAENGKTRACHSESDREITRFETLRLTTKEAVVSSLAALVGFEES